MEQYIPKSAVVAEIENLLKPVKQRLERDKNNPWDSDIALYKFGDQLIKNIETLEMKEVQEEPKIPQVFDEGYWERLGEEPVSEDLEIAANEWDAKASFTPFYMALDDNGNPYEIRQDYTTHAESFKAGAKWQKEKEYTCYEEAFEDGAKWQKEHMMVKAINAHCFGFQGAALFSFKLPADNYLIGSEVKVIVIKED